MSSLTRWRRDAARRVPGGNVGLAVLAAAVVGGGYYRYKQVKVGDTVRVKVDAPNAQQFGLTLGQTFDAKVVSLPVLSKSPYTVAPILGGVQAPVSVSVSQEDVLQNLTPRLF